MFFLGFLSFLQQTFLPGWLFLTFTKSKNTSLLERLIYSFAISWWLNYLLVFLLTSLGLYSRILIIFIIGIELCLFFIIYKKDPVFKKYPKLNTRFLKKPIFLIATIPTLIVLVSYFGVIVDHSNRLSIFSTWDAIASWNRWATDWSQGIFPKLSWEYPQLIPTNWSLNYLVVGASYAQFWNKIAMNLFPLATMSLFGLWSLRKKSSLYLLGIPLYYLSLIHFYNFSFAIDGYVDVALTFYSFLAFYCLNGDTDQQKYFFSLLFAAAAVTKQLGLLIFLFISLINFKKIAKSKRLLITWLLLISLTLVWYIFKRYQIIMGIDVSNLEVLLQETKTAQSAYPDNVLSKLLFGVTWLFGFKIEAQILLTVLVALAFHACDQKQTRQIIGIFVIPFFVIWSIWFSYNNMNVFIAIPFLIFCSLLGISQLTKSIGKIPIYLIFSSFLTCLLFYSHIPFINRHSLLMIPVFAVVVFALSRLSLKLPNPILTITFLFLTVLYVGNYRFNDSVLLSTQLSQRRLLGIPDINKKIYEYHQKYGLHGKILTSFQYICFLPEIDKYCQIYPNQLDIAEAQKQHASYIFNSDAWLTPETIKTINKNLKTGSYKLIFEQYGYRFIQID